MDDSAIETVDQLETAPHAGSVSDPQRGVATAAWAPGHEAIGSSAFRTPGPPATTLAALIERAAEGAASDAALIDGARRLTHRELHRHASQLAQYLAGRGVAAGDTVGIALERSADAVVAMLAAWKLGAAYLPLDPALPLARLEIMLAASRTRVVVTRIALRDRLPAATDVVLMDGDAAAIAAKPERFAQALVSATDPAYIIFTSGSTGTPKGVVVTHGNAAHYTRAIARILTGTTSDGSFDELPRLASWSFALVSTLAADLGHSVLLPALCAGATLHVLDEAHATEPAQFAEYMASNPIDVLKITPSHFRALAGDLTREKAGAIFPARALILGGEALDIGFAEQLLAAGCRRVLNHYGPTETTVGACTFEVTAASVSTARSLGARSIPIGWPLSGVRVAVLDGEGSPVAVGAAGELYIAGDGVAQGYINDAELTAARFVVAQALGRAYRTGDRVRCLADGSLEFLGRTDDQVKVRGHRVELREIEHALKQCPGVVDAAVILSETSGAEAQLIAYGVLAGGYVSAAGRPTAETTRETLAARLPHYMVPDRFLFVDSLPLTPNGKIDRQALAKKASESGGAAEDTHGYVAPRTETERILAHIWSEALRVDRVGMTDRFLELGGHSLQAIRILGKLSRAFGVRIPLRTMFESATVEQLARAVDSARSGSVAG